jgi:hypothetical protein
LGFTCQFPQSLENQKMVIKTEFLYPYIPPIEMIFLADETKNTILLIIRNSKVYTHV